MSRIDATDLGAANSNDASTGSQRRELPAAAKRALAEAEARRIAQEKAASDAPKEHGGREGPDPVRYGDWENDGIVSDF